MISEEGRLLNYEEEWKGMRIIWSNLYLRFYVERKEIKLHVVLNINSVSRVELTFNDESHPNIFLRVVD